MGILNRIVTVGSLSVLCVLASACAGIPQSVRLYASNLPARADGQYALLSDADVKKQLVLNDSLLQCKIDTADGIDEAKSTACQCAESTGDWLTDCKPWLGAHTPAAPPPTPPAPSTNNG